MKPHIVVITGPSGVGKQTVIKELLNLLQSKGIDCSFSVSHTTRTPREGENEGEHYHFVSRREFEEMTAWQAFLEHAEVHGNFYGTAAKPVSDALQKGKLVILDIDVQGAEKVRAEAPIRGLPYLDIFVRPPAPEIETLRQRLVGRQTDKPETIEKRLKNAEAELQRSGEFLFVVTNHDGGAHAAAVDCLDFIMSKVMES